MSVDLIEYSSYDKKGYPMLNQKPHGRARKRVKYGYISNTANVYARKTCKDGKYLDEFLNKLRFIGGERMNIRNMRKDLKRKVKKCINLLEDEYSSIDYTIVPYPERTMLEHERKENPELSDGKYEQILNGERTIAGLTIKEKKEIKSFLFQFGDIENDPEEILHYIGNIYHEIRHAWQYENNLFQDEEEMDNIDEDFESYFMQGSEKDAFQFQLEQIRKHGDEILKIFNINMSGKGWRYNLTDEVMKAIES